MFKRHIGQIGVVLIIAGISNLAPAEIITPTTRANEIIVTATRSESDIAAVPANVSVISEADIRKSSAQSIPDVLRTENGLVVRDWTGTGKSATVDIRGFGETGALNTLVLVDGRRVTQIDLSGTDWTQIPLEDVSRIEIIRGAGSVLYGDNAAGGVINIITKKGLSGSRAQLKTENGSYNARNLILDGQGGNQEIYFSVNQTYRKTDGYRDNSYLESNDNNTCLGIRFTPDFNIEASLGAHTDEYGLPGTLTPTEIAQLGRGATHSPDDYATTEDSYFKLQVSKFIEHYESWLSTKSSKLTIDMSQRDKTSDTIYAKYGTYTNDIKSKYISPRYEMKGDALGTDDTMIFGVDLLADKADLSGTKADKSSTGFYGLWDISMFDIWGVNLGYRHEKAFYQFGGGTVSARKTHKEDVSNFGFRYYYLEERAASVYANYAKSFRFPAVDEYFSVWSGLNSSLKPQSGTQTEAGIRHRFGQDYFVNLSAFRMITDNEIFYNPYSPPFGANENYDRINREGVEAKLGVPYAVFNYTYTKPEFRAGQFKGNDVPGVPRRKISAALTAPEIIAYLEAGLSLNYVGKRYLISDQPNKQKPLATYTTVDLKIGYKFKNLNISCGVNNLGNKKYEEYGSTNPAGTIALYPSPERNFVFGLSLVY